MPAISAAVPSQDHIGSDGQAAGPGIAARGREDAIAAERARMARDLHDVVAGRLSAIALQSEAALQPGADPELVRRVLATVRESGVAALGEMRAMIGLLRAGDAADPPAAPARLSELDDLLAGARTGGLDVELADDRPPGTTAPAPVELAAYRVVQEALTNVTKHAPGAPVRVRLAVDRGDAAGPARVAHPVPGPVPGTHVACHSAGASRRPDGDTPVVEVRNGAGDRPEAAIPGVRGGTGLAGLDERARAAGGTLTAGPDGDGWLVCAALPLSTEGGHR